MPTRWTSRTWYGFQSGAWYQVSPETMSSLPSLSTSKTPAASNSLWPLIVCCFHLGSSALTKRPPGAENRNERSANNQTQNRVIDASPESGTAIQTLGSVQGLRYSLVRYWFASGWLMIRSATGSHVSFSPVQSEMLPRLPTLARRWP